MNVYSVPIEKLRKISSEQKNAAGMTIFRVNIQCMYKSAPSMQKSQQRYLGALTT
jgi:hypothetical protein